MSKQAILLSFSNELEEGGGWGGWVKKKCYCEAVCLLCFVKDLAIWLLSEFLMHLIRKF